jgi:hypothetical protein
MNTNAIRSVIGENPLPFILEPERVVGFAEVIGPCRGSIDCGGSELVLSESVLHLSIACAELIHVLGGLFKSGM